MPCLSSCSCNVSAVPTLSLFRFLFRHCFLLPTTFPFLLLLGIKFLPWLAFIYFSSLALSLTSCLGARRCLLSCLLTYLLSRLVSRLLSPVSCLLSSWLCRTKCGRKVQHSGSESVAFESSLYYCLGGSTSPKQCWKMRSADVSKCLRTSLTQKETISDTFECTVKSRCKSDKLNLFTILPDNRTGERIRNRARFIKLKFSSIFCSLKSIIFCESIKENIRFLLYVSVLTDRYEFQLRRIISYSRKTTKSTHECFPGNELRLSMSIAIESNSLPNLKVPKHNQCMSFMRAKVNQSNNT